MSFGTGLSIAIAQEVIEVGYTNSFLLIDEFCVDCIYSRHIADVDDEDIENDTNTYVDIAGDTMTGPLVVPNVTHTIILNITAPQINSTGNFTHNGDMIITLNLTVLDSINTINLTLENLFGASPFNVWNSFSMNWETISETELNNTIINNGTANNLNMTNYTGFPNPKFDSGWIPFNPGDKKLIRHDAGGNASNYFPMVLGYAAAYGVNMINFGTRHLSYGAAGYRWEFLNSTHIQLWRLPQDVSAEKMRVFLWEFDNPAGGTEILLLEANANDTDVFSRNAVYDNATIGNSIGNMSINEDGSLTLIGAASKQEDLRFPSIYLKSAGVNLPSFSVFLNNTYVWLFDKNKNEELFLLGQTPHRRANGTDMDAHFHWTPVTADSGDVVWCIEYAWANIDATFVNSTTQCILDAASGVQYQHQMTSMIEMDGSGKNLSSAISARIYRDADNASDDYAFDAALVEFDFHYDVGSFGSDAI